MQQALLKFLDEFRKKGWWIYRKIKSSGFLLSPCWHYYFSFSLTKTLIFEGTQEKRKNKNFPCSANYQTRYFDTDFQRDLIVWTWDLGTSLVTRNPASKKKKKTKLTANALSAKYQLIPTMNLGQRYCQLSKAGGWVDKLIHPSIVSYGSFQSNVSSNRFNNKSHNIFYL